jgi:hypothetical protein
MKFLDYVVFCVGVVMLAGAASVFFYGPLDSLFDVVADLVVFLIGGGLTIAGFHRR